MLNPKKVSKSQVQWCLLWFFCLQLRGEVSCSRFPMEKMRNRSHCRHRERSLQGLVCSQSPKSPPRITALKLPRSEPELRAWDVGRCSRTSWEQPSDPQGVSIGKRPREGQGSHGLLRGSSGRDRMKPFRSPPSSGGSLQPTDRPRHARRGSGRASRSVSVCSELAGEPLLPEIKGAVLGHEELPFENMPAAAVGPWSSPGPLPGRGILGMGHSKLGEQLFQPNPGASWPFSCPSCGSCFLRLLLALVNLPPLTKGVIC